jgi:hypothetical protein
VSVSGSRLKGPPIGVTYGNSALQSKFILWAYCILEAESASPQQRDHKFGIWISVFRRLCWFSLPLICRLHSGSTSENVVAYAGGAQCLQSAMGPKTCWPPYSPRRLHFYAASSLRGEHETGLQNSNAFIKTTHICSSMDIDFLIFIPAPFPTIYAT